MNQVSTDPDVTHGNHDDAEYDAFLMRVQARFIAACEGGQAPLFATDAVGLFDAYLASFGDEPTRQYHNCHACRTFIERFGGLVTIDAAGRTAPAIWHSEDAPDHYLPAVAADVLDLGRAAALLGVARSTLVTQAKPRGNQPPRIRARKLGRNWVTDGAAVYAYAERRARSV